MSRGLGGGTKITAPLKRYVKRHFLESELATVDDLVREYADEVIEYTCEECGHGVDVVEESKPINRQKLIWLLERIQEEVL